MGQLLSNDIFNTAGYTRKFSLEVSVGDVAMGGSNPIRLQTMTTTNTNDTTATVEQCIRAIKAGAEFVRITTQGVKEALSLELVKKELLQKGFNNPIIADIHFNPAAALEAAKYADKIRVNPGNFSDKSRTSKFTFTEKEYENDLQIAETRFVELLEVCKANNVAIRIGVNHGSLSQRIMSRYGDTPIGMAHSAMEFVRICQKYNHQKVVVSMKSSNTRVMVQATRCLVKMMRDEGLNFPLHLGVTEAGEGEDGRIKSAVGIGALLVDGVGDTIRVSLTEPPENEIPVAHDLVSIFSNWQNLATEQPVGITVDPFDYNRQKTKSILGIGGDKVPAVVAYITEICEQSLNDWGWLFDGETKLWQSSENAADFFIINSNSPVNIPCYEQLPIIGYDFKCKYKLVNYIDLEKNKVKDTDEFFVLIESESFSLMQTEDLKRFPNAVLVVTGKNQYSFFAIRNILFDLRAKRIINPCVVLMNFSSVKPNNFQVTASALLGPLFIDGLADGIAVKAPVSTSLKEERSTLFGILQAARVRFTKTEFISCPGCGRTLFNLNETLVKVKERTSHLKGLKIGVMGCIVNGPGEMADADYGYVGSGPGRVNLYLKKEVVKKNVPEENAVDELINLIKINGDWREA